MKRTWTLGTIELSIDHVQGDPFAAPSRLSARADTGIPTEWLRSRDAREAAEDWLLRRFSESLRSEKRGSGRSGQISVYQPGPEVCERSTVRVDPDGRVLVRFSVGLPARGRRILGRQAAELLCRDVPSTLRRLDAGADAGLRAHIDSVLQQRALRRRLDERGLVGFIANGSILPRQSGVDGRPLANAVPFQSPPELEVTLDTPQGPVSGMGVAAGVTVITGGGFHGKSTVLDALQRGHLDHIPGDGRERVVALADTVKVRAEDGRSVRNVDISAFLGDLPGGRATRDFSTDDASGSTSQAAAIVEALESGARVLLIDEDTSATNLLVRDERMSALIPDDREPITPFVRRVRQLHAELGVSTILVIGGVGDYLGAADRVIAMTDWLPSDVTARAHELAPERPVAPGPIPTRHRRCPRPRGLGGRVRARDDRAVSIDREEIVLTAVEHVLDAPHAATLGHALAFMGDLANGERSLSQVLDALDAILDDEGVEALSPFECPPGNLIRPRRHEIAAAINRYRQAGWVVT